MYVFYSVEALAAISKLQVAKLVTIHSVASMTQVAQNSIS